MLRNLFVTVLFRIFVGKFERKNVNQEDLLKGIVAENASTYQNSCHCTLDQSASQLGKKIRAKTFNKIKFYLQRKFRKYPHFFIIKAESTKPISNFIT